VTFRAESHRNVFVSKLLAIAMIPLGWVVGITSVLLTYVATLLSTEVTSAGGRWLALHFAARFFLQFVVPFLVSVLFVTIVFLVIPSKRIKLSTAIAGSCLFSALVELVKHAFTWYVAHHTRYHAIFGSLETVVILVIWVYYMALIFLFCAEIMSSYERRDMLLIEHMLLSRNSRMGRQRLFRKFGQVFPAGSLICREGDQSQEMFFIISGSVRLETKAGLTKKNLALLSTGDHFGEMAALTGCPRTATAVAVVDCDIAVIDGGVFQRLLRESDDLSLHLLKEFSGRIRRGNAALEGLSQSWIHLVVILLLMKNWPYPPGRDIPGELAVQAGKDATDIQEILQDLGDRGVITLGENGPLGLDPERAWGLILELIASGGSPSRTP
jgi:CRP-like cAMP-binding protein